MSDESKAEVKPGFKTTEFWLSALALVVGLIQGSGAVADDSGPGKVIGLAAMALIAAGYSVGRGLAKKG